MDELERSFRLASSEPRLWSLRLAERSYRNGNDEHAYHAFLLLYDETGPQSPKPLTELHFNTADIPEERLIPYKPDLKLLGANAYKNPRLDFPSLHMATQAKGTPQDILPLWNEACRIAIAIRDIHRPFADNYNCRAGAKTVIEGLGLAFKAFAHEKMQRGLKTNLRNEIQIPAAMARDADPLTTYRDLNEKLTAPRTPSNG